MYVGFSNVARTIFVLLINSCMEGNHQGTKPFVNSALKWLQGSSVVDLLHSRTELYCIAGALLCVTGHGGSSSTSCDSNTAVSTEPTPDSSKSDSNLVKDPTEINANAEHFPAEPVEFDL